jgi:tRNA-specific 2-thiouridylase
MKKERVVVAMSGGVDSSMAAWFLKHQGYEVIGLSMKLPFTNSQSEGKCCGVEGIESARYTAQQLNIPFYAVNYEREFQKKVIDYFGEQYKKGLTPNPCIICNQEIKFRSLLGYAQKLGAKYLATGHYARIEYNLETKNFELKKGVDSEKDQSYFLFTLSFEQLSQILFPLGNYRKKEVRELAHQAGLKVYNRPASYEICFIPNNNYIQFLKNYFFSEKIKPGPILNQQGEIVGQHQGIVSYTIGQRKGIGAFGKPVYVIAIDYPNNTITVGSEEELYHSTLIAERVHWIEKRDKVSTREVEAKIRSRHPPSPAQVFPLPEGKVRVVFQERQRAITPGQAVVFYQGEKVLGGGWIEKVEN